MANKHSRAAKPPRPVKVILRWVLSTLSVAALLITALVIFHQIERFLIEDPRFTLGSPEQYGDASPNIRVEGIVHASRSRVMDVFAEDTGRSLYLFPAAERRRGLFAADWVKNASVARIWPNRVEVRIEERRPVAFVELPPRRRGALHHVALIDAEGVILEQPPRSRYDLPVLTGIREEQSETMRALRVRRMQRFLSDIGEMGNRISEINVADPNNLKIVMNAGGLAVSLSLGRENYSSRLQNFLRHYPEIRRRLPAAATFDLRLDDRITAADGVANEG
jgi:cell division protein FtsQ